jgi:hypothetical protein
VLVGLVSVAVGGPLFYLAGREAPAPEREGGDEAAGASQVIGSVTGPVFGPRSDFRGAWLVFGSDPAAVVTPLAGQVVVGEIPREPPEFVRRVVLDELAAVARQGQVAVVCAVTGLRGVGKTQLAAVYARDRIAAGCGLVGWVNAESADSLLADLERVARAVGVDDPEGDSGESAARLREHLDTRPGESLLVFDNASDPDRLRRFLPATGGTVVVITSVDRAFVELGTPVEVPVFRRQESVTYLAARTGRGGDGADQIAAELGDLPLGVAQAAATIRANERLTYQQYLDKLRRVPVSEALSRVVGGDYPRATAAALLLNLQAAEAGAATGLTGRLLRVIAMLSPDGVPRDLLAGLAPARPGRADEMAAAIVRCVTASLLSWSVGEETLIMHRLLGRVLREGDRASGQQAGTIAAALDLLEPRLFSDDEAWDRR